MNGRKQLERDFHDRLRQVDDDVHVADTRWSVEMEETIKRNPLWVNMKFYSIERKSRQAVLRWYEENTPGKTVLDYCCGNGEDARLIAKNGAESVTGIDLSDVTIENCIRSAEEEGCSDNTTFLTRDAENTGFEDNSFDVVTEYGALHHLKLENAFSETARILKPDGKFICVEALAQNPLIHMYRRLTPHLRTEWEVDHILRKESFDVARKYFGKVEHQFFHLCTLVAVPIRTRPGFAKILGALEHVDSWLLRLPGLKWWAWQTVFVLSNPKK